MDTQIPSAAEIAERMADMNPPQLQRLADLSGVPFHTLLKIKSRETMNPRIDTVRQFAPFISEAAGPAAATTGAT